jgi:imidazole glycerol-phosphate synthase subunit HisF
MKRVRVIATLLLTSHKLVKTTQFKLPVYVGDPINALRIFNEKEVDEICVLDITANESSGPDMEYIKLLTSECFMPLAYGGNVQTLQQAKEILKSGVEKIIFGEAANSNPALINEVSKAAGSQSVVVSIDVKKDWLGRSRVFVHKGTIKTTFTPVQYAQRMEQLGAGELLLQNIDREGTFSGYDHDLIQEVSASVEIPIIASGGASSVQDFLSAIQSGASAVAAGAMFVYKGSRKAVLINYPDQEKLMSELYSKL